MFGRKAKKISELKRKVIQLEIRERGTVIWVETLESGISAKSLKMYGALKERNEAREQIATLKKQHKKMAAKNGRMAAERDKANCEKEKLIDQFLAERGEKESLEISVRCLKQEVTKRRELYNDMSDKRDHIYHEKQEVLEANEGLKFEVDHLKNDLMKVQVERKRWLAK